MGCIDVESRTVSVKVNVESWSQIHTSKQDLAMYLQNNQCHVHLQSMDYCLGRQDLVCQKRGSDTTALGSSFPVKRYHMFSSDCGRGGLIETFRPSFLGRGVGSGCDHSKVCVLHALFRPVLFAPYFACHLNES